MVAVRLGGCQTAKVEYLLPHEAHPYPQLLFFRPIAPSESLPPAQTNP